VFGRQAATKGNFCGMWSGCSLGALISLSDVIWVDVLDAGNDCEWNQNWPRSCQLRGQRQQFTKIAFAAAWRPNFHILKIFKLIILINGESADY